MKNKWAKVSRTVISIKTEKPLVADDFEDLVTDPQKLQTTLSKQSSATYAALNTYLAKCDGYWMKQFLDGDALFIIFNLLHFMGSKAASGFRDTVLQLQIVTVLKSILNDRTGIDYLLHEENQIVLQLALGKNKATAFKTHAKISKE